MKTIQLVGPFITNYSLARVNRGLAYAMSQIQKEYKVQLYQDMDKFDRYPTSEDQKKFPEIIKLWNKEKEESDVVIYNDFPKTGYVAHGLNKLPGKIKLMYLAWEESVYPKMWVDEVNQNLHGVMVASSFVQKILRKEGIKVPIAVVPNGIDKNVMVQPTQKYPLKTKKKFKFLHISSARTRKGIDVLLKAYFEEFTKEDDVCLVIKSFPGPENLVNDLLGELRKENSPEVEHIFDSELTDQDLVNLNASCDCAVYPTRAEGFGLPIAEAMYIGIPVIATNYSAHLDFFSEENGFPVKYKLVEATNSEMINLGAKWAEPDLRDLKRQMRLVYSSQSDSKLTDVIAQKVKNAKTTALNLNWTKSAEEALNYIKKIEKIAHLKNKKLAVLGRINSEDGVAEYTANIYRNIQHSFKEFYFVGNKDIDDRVREDEPNVVRIWEVGDESFDDVISFLQKEQIELFHIQYHSGFNFPVRGLDNLIKKSKDLKCKVYVTLHAVRGPGFDFIKESQNLKLADRLYIHNINDYNYAKTFLKNVYRIPIPTLEFTDRNKEEIRKHLGLQDCSPIIASHGLMNSNKNIPSIIEAIKLLKTTYPNLLFLSINAVSSNNIASAGEFERAKALVQKYDLHDNVRFITKFLDVKQIEVLLQSADINILAYTEVGESSSDAVRKCLASKNPTIVTDIKMLSEFDNEVFKISDASVTAIVDGIKKIWEDKALYKEIQENARAYNKLNGFEIKSLEMIMQY